MCIEAYTVKINKGLVTSAESNLSDLKGRLSEIENKHKHKFNEEYNNLLKTLVNKNFEQTEEPIELIDKSKILPPRILDSQKFLEALDEILLYMKNRLKEKVIRFEDTINVLK